MSDRDGWDAAARENAMGYILTGVHWDPEDFYANGREEIGRVLARLDEKNLRVAVDIGLALDFGCGVGRLTVALADHYESVKGVDVSSEMIARARPCANVFYEVIDPDGFPPDEPRGIYDLVYTSLVLQHMPREDSSRWIRDLLTMLRPDGLLVFQIPDGPDVMHAASPFLSMWGTKRAGVHKLVADAGAEIVDEYRISEHDTWDPWLYTARLK